MPSTKNKKTRRLLKENGNSSSDDNNDSEHELFYYSKDRVKLMKELLKLIKPKKVKSMAPDCIKNLNIAEINSMLLEELLGISNKRLRSILNGENLNTETSSSESEDEIQPVDVISLDDISDDDDIELCISDTETKPLKKVLPTERGKHKSQTVKKKIAAIAKSEKYSPINLKQNSKKMKLSNECKDNPILKDSERERLMSVLELLELQARARAIRSQLAIEPENRDEPTTSKKTINTKREENSDSDVIVESPKHKEIVISSSDSEQEQACRNFSLQKNMNLKNPSEELKLLQEAQTDDLKSYSINDQPKLDTNTIEQEVAKRKEKLFSKIQKIRLIRNKTVTSQKENIVEFNEITQRKTVDNRSNETLTDSNAIELLKDNATVTTNYKAIVNDNYSLTSRQNTLKHQSTENSSEKTEIRSVNNIQNNYCESDEIVINLEEDEIHEIENE